MSEARINCQICDVCVYKYECPRCKVQYCSLNCYKSDKHKVCSELFYRDCVMDELKGVYVNKDLQEKMESILASENKKKSENSTEEHIEPLEDRMYDLNLDEDTDEIWNRLTESEREDFHKFVKSKDVQQFIKCWKPWWMFKAVEEVDCDSSRSTIPRNMKIISPMVSLCPNALMKYTVVNALLVYAYVARLYNGDHQRLYHETVPLFQDLCCSLFSPVPHSSLEEVVADFLLKTTDIHVPLNNAFLLLLLDDVFMFLKSEETGRHFIVPALSDLRSMLKRSDDDLKRGVKKLEFLISWIHTASNFRSSVDQLKEELAVTKMTNIRL